MRTRRKFRDYDPDEVARDGETVRCPVHLMDSWQRSVASWAAKYSLHQRGYRTDAEIVRRRAILATDRELSDARARAMDARRQMIERATSAWRRPWPVQSGDAAQPDTSNLPDPDNGNGNGNENERDRAYADRIANLQNAWRSPGVTNPAAATQVERMRRAVTNEDRR
jgi:hypothetical protein